VDLRTDSDCCFKHHSPWCKVFTARYGLNPYIKQVFITVVKSVYSAVRTDSLYKACFITVVESVYSAVRTESLYIAGFYNRGGKCLQRGTH
jgi:hypothetical protein